MEFEHYEVVIAPEVLDKIASIESYITEHFSITSSKRRIKAIFDAIQGLENYPEIGFDADDKVGWKIDDRYNTRGVVLKHQYLLLYAINTKDKIVYITHLFSTKEDYLDLLK